MCSTQDALQNVRHLRVMTGDVGNIPKMIMT